MNTMARTFPNPSPPRSSPPQLPNPIMRNNMRRKKRKSVSQRRRSNSTKPDYNSLEQRLALTTFVVTSLDDGIANDGLVTLREAIVAANTNAASGDAAAGNSNGDIIRFAPSLADGTINLTEGQLTISDDLSIQGGDLNITVDAQNLSRAFEITGSESVSLGGINVTRGNADIGGGVLASGSGNVIVFGGEFSDNVATGIGGGAIYSTTGNLFVSGGTTFDGNIASGESGSGGAIFNEGGIASANGASFSNNEANRDGGAIEITGGELFLTNVEADRNIAGPEGSAAPGSGGVLHVTAGDVVSVTDSRFSSNFAALEGGGLWIQDDTNLFVNGNTTFSFNTAAGDGADDGGGAIFNNGGTVIVNGASFDGNRATGTDGGGGAIFSVAGSVTIQRRSGFSSEFTDNSSTRAGGAVEIIDGFFRDVRSTYTSNRAGSTQSPGSGDGGAVHITGTGTLSFAGSLFFANSAGTFVANSPGSGGAVWNSAESNATFDEVVFDRNRATGTDVGNGGAVFNNGGVISIDSATFTDNTAGGSGGAILSVGGRISIDHSEFAENTSAGTGGAIKIIDGSFSDEDSVYTANESLGDGGAFHATGTSDATFSRSELNRNTASNGGAVWSSAGSRVSYTRVNFSFNVANGSGGAVFNEGGSQRVIASNFEDNDAIGEAGSGGAIFSVDGEFDVVLSSFENNLSNRAGGAIHIGGNQTHLFSRTSFTNNFVHSEGGGAVWISAGSTTTFNDTSFTANTLSLNNTEGGGGAIFNNGGDLTINGGLFERNDTIGTVARGGGAIFSVDGRVLVFNESQFIGNRTSTAGGAVEIIDGEFFDTGSIYSNNVAESSTSPSNGGAFHITGTATAAFSGTEFRNNRAANEGGAVWNAAGSTTFLTDVQIIGNVASGNAADNGGGGIFNDGGSVFVNNSLLSGNIANGDSGSGGAALSVDGVLRFDHSSIFSNQAARAGGGVEVIDGRAVFRTVTLDSNTTGIVLTAAPGNGGGLHVSGNNAIVTFDNSVIANNSAANQGGGLWNQTGSSIFLDGATSVRSNTAQGVGGGLYNQGFLSATDTFFINNRSEDDGGGIYISPTGQARLEDSLLSLNEAADDGGAIFNLGNLFTLDSSFIDNLADNTGGAIFTGPEAITTIGLDNFFSENLPSS